MDETENRNIVACIKDDNKLKTLLGGRDLMALDWVGASKMGLDPLESVLMKKAVHECG